VAIAVADEIRVRGLDPARVRVLVSGGHGDPEAFEAAFRSHLVAAGPSLGLDAVTIVRVPATYLCAICAGVFRTAEPDPACPGCGGPGLSAAHAESVEIEWDEPPAGRGPLRPTHDDPRHSTDRGRSRTLST
jgi:Zn finger protein HypA/HybF involved in hydrogenase expression